MSLSDIENVTGSANGVLTIALAGNPNCGKTTIFNEFTKLKQKVGNYPGVTVEKKLGQLALTRDRIINIIDLPGTYSLSTRSLDEKVARDVLLGRVSETARPDMVVCVIDASNLERNLYLFNQIQDLGVPVVIALNMMDEVARKGQDIDVEKLSSYLSVPIIPMVANKGQGLDQLKKVLASKVVCEYKRKWSMSQEVEDALQPLISHIACYLNVNESIAFSEALLLLSSKDSDENKEFYGSKIITLAEEIRANFSERKIRWRSEMVEARYNWIRSGIKRCVKQKGDIEKSLTDKIDAVLTHKVFGWMFFVGIMAFMFHLIFTWSGVPMDMIDAAFGAAGDFALKVLPEGDFRDLVVDGIIGGVGGVVIFLPQILILFFFIGLLQDTGYMARAAFIMDRVMTKVGLHGKSFIPMLSSYACAIPGIMAARTIESEKDRLVTILVAPLMSCAARLPVYMIMIAVLMPEASALEKTGVLLSLYLLGTFFAAIMAWLFKKTLLKGRRPSFIMELPPYRMPSFKAIVFQMWERAQLFLKRAGTVILALSIVLWALMSFPKTADDASLSEQLKQSYAGQMGQMLEPAIKPLGYDWRIGVGLIGSFAAREVFVSTMSIIFNMEEDSEDETLREGFASATWPDGRPLFTPLVCVSVMVFFVFAMQCIATVGVVVRETNGWKWPLFQLFYMTVLAYVMALFVYQGGRLLGLG